MTLILRYTMPELLRYSLFLAILKLIMVFISLKPVVPEDFETKEELYTALFFYLQDVVQYLVLTILNILLVN